MWIFKYSYWPWLERNTECSNNNSLELISVVYQWSATILATIIYYWKKIKKQSFGKPRIVIINYTQKLIQIVTESGTETDIFFKFNSQVLQYLMHFLLLKLNFLATQQFTQENVLSVILQVTAVSLYSSITAFSGALRYLTPDICTVLAAHTVLLPSRTLLVSSYHKSFSRHTDNLILLTHFNIILLLSKDKFLDPQLFSCWHLNTFPTQTES